MPTKAVAFSRRFTSPPLSGDYAMLYVSPTNMIAVETEHIVGVFQGVTLADDPAEVTIDFFLTDPRPFLPPSQKYYSEGGWQDGSGQDGWLAFNQSHAAMAKRVLESMHQFTIPTGPNLIGVSDDLVNIEDYKWIAVRVAYAHDPSADVYVQITPQSLPSR